MIKKNYKVGIVSLLILVNILVYSNKLSPTAKDVLNDVPIFGSELQRNEFVAVNQQNPDSIEIPIYMFGVRLSKKHEVKYED